MKQRWIQARRRLARWLRRLALWVDPEVSKADLVLELARGIVWNLHTSPHTGAYKRAQAMKALQAEVSLSRKGATLRRRDLAMAIERAVQELP